MPKFRKKQIVIEAVKASDVVKCAATEWSALPKWIIDAYDQAKLVITSKNVHIHTLEGVMDAAIDDWIIQGVKGEIYPCKPDIFELTYEEDVTVIENSKDILRGAGWPYQQVQ